MQIRCPKCKAIVPVAEVPGSTRVGCPSCGATLKVRPKARGPAACPSCGHALPPGAVVCVQCGLDLKRGGRVPEARGQRIGDRARGRSSPVVTFVGELLPALLRPSVLLASLVLAAAGLGVVGLGIWLLKFTRIGCILVAGVGAVFYGQAVAWLLDGEFTLIHEALAGFDGLRWALFFALILLPFSVAIGILKSSSG